MPMRAENKYFSSDWRRNDEHCPGGFMMESSVHFIAALRMLAAAGGALVLCAQISQAGLYEASQARVVLYNPLTLRAEVPLPRAGM